jgi:formate-nitrite transporter family protein
MGDPHNGQPADKPKPANEILDELTETGLEEYKRPRRQLFISAFTGGMEGGFSVLLMGVLYSLLAEDVSEVAMHMILATAYPLGFLFVVIGRSELFTEHTDVALLPVLARKVAPLELLKLWGTIFSGNLLGGYLIGAMLILIGPGLGVINDDALIHLAEKMIPYDWWVILGSGILAGWLMGLLTWLVGASQETISRMLVVILVTIVIGIAGLHHSIVGSIEVFCGAVIDPDITPGDYFHFQLWATVGNIIGGGVFVGLFKFGQSAKVTQ